MERTNISRQAGRAVLVAPMIEAWVRLGEWQRRRQMRKAFGLASDTLLRDIGLTPDDLQEARSASLEADSSDTLLKAALARAGNW